MDSLCRDSSLIILIIHAVLGWRLGYGINTTGAWGSQTTGNILGGKPRHVYCCPVRKGLEDRYCVTKKEREEEEKGNL